MKRFNDMHEFTDYIQHNKHCYKGQEKVRVSELIMMSYWMLQEMIGQGQLKYDAAAMPKQALVIGQIIDIEE